MREPSVVPISHARARAQRRMRDLAAAARGAAYAAAHPDIATGVHEPPSSSGGRAWLNGREIGGYDRRFAHLTRAYE